MRMLELAIYFGFWIGAGSYIMLLILDLDLFWILFGYSGFYLEVRKHMLCWTSTR